MPIHIVDDEALITEFLSKALRQHSNQISCFQSGIDYLSHLHSDDYVEPRLIITDVRMPGIDGFELIKRIRASQSNVKIIVMSGYHNLPESPQETTCHTFEKPLNVKNLLAIVSQTLSCDRCPLVCEKQCNSASAIQG
ncbi:response regulator [Mariprofundus sp. NF]|uniref:response regulator n=1 Tax=Mariprofundus sp. NF TaxID=2608716 RepID=UPI00159FD8DB|nr:response regulator [Mariprofundus sp. NF]NWF38196.1 response regulator [Mariprofundus sp. NF]